MRTPLIRVSSSCRLQLSRVTGSPWRRYRGRPRLRSRRLRQRLAHPTGAHVPPRRPGLRSRNSPPTALGAPPLAPPTDGTGTPPTSGTPAQKVGSSPALPCRRRSIFLPSIEYSRSLCFSCFIRILCSPFFLR